MTALPKSSGLPIDMDTATASSLDGASHEDDDSCHENSSFTSVSEADAEYHLVVVGAGFNGLMAAKTYLHLNPGARVMICEANETLGGVWAHNRLYPHLRTNNMFGTFEYPDFPAADLGLGVKKGEYMSGGSVYHYLNLFADEFDLRRRIRLKTGVATARNLGKSEGWSLTLTYGDGDEEAQQEIQAHKLIMATGICSEPRMPHFPGQEHYNGHLHHGRDLAKIDPHALGLSYVCVYGGTKMAFDAVYHFATAGCRVHWLMRSSGHGPAWMGPSYVTPFKLYMEDLVMTRAAMWPSACAWAPRTGVEGLARALFARTRLGRWMVRGVFKGMAHGLVAQNRYEATAETRKLVPWVSPLWVGAGRGIITSYPTPFVQLIESGQVDIHINELTELAGREVILKSGKTLPADAFVSCTGWRHKPTVRFLPDGIEEGLGIPTGRPAEATAYDEEADARIYEDYPLLRDPPVFPKPTAAKDSKDEGGFRLYRFVAPPPPPYLHQHNLAFAGYAQTIATPVLATVQSLWIAAYLSDSLPSVDPALDQEIAASTALHTRFTLWRYPAGMSSRFPDFVFDALPYIDLLLRDLGLDPRRKRVTLKSWAARLGDACTFGALRKLADFWVNAFTANRRVQYASLVEEWLAVRGSRGKLTRG